MRFMRTLYFDCFAGISGDMTLGAFIDLGVDKEILIKELDKLKVSGYKIDITKKSKNGIVGTDVDVVLNSEKRDIYDHKHDEDSHIHDHTHVHLDEVACDNNHVYEGVHNYACDKGHINHNEHSHGFEEHHHRSFRDIRELIEDSNLDKNVKGLSIKIFYNVAKAEAKIHGKEVDEVHFHEVGAIDSIVDIVGTAICFNELRVDKVVSSPLHIGMGTIKCQHGVIPVPAPATLDILREGSVPIYSTGVKKEIVTPTGAAIVATLADEYGDIPEGVVESIGYGCGKRKTELANMLRLTIIESKKKKLNDIYVLESNIDDMTGEVAGFAMDSLLSNGALDVFYTSIQMKKNRPAYKLTVLCNEGNLEKMKRIIFKETSTIGIRMYKVHRECMDREFKTVDTPYGQAVVKISRFEDIVNIAPEYEDCKRLATESNISIREVYDSVKRSVYNGKY